MLTAFLSEERVAMTGYLGDGEFFANRGITFSTFNMCNVRRRKINPPNRLLCYIGGG